MLYSVPYYTTWIIHSRKFITYGPRPFYTMPNPDDPSSSNSYDLFIRYIAASVSLCFIFHLDSGDVSAGAKKFAPEVRGVMIRYVFQLH